MDVKNLKDAKTASDLEIFHTVLNPGLIFFLNIFSSASCSAIHGSRFKNDKVLQRPWNEKVNSSVDIVLGLV